MGLLAVCTEMHLRPLPLGLDDPEMLHSWAITGQVPASHTLSRRQGALRGVGAGVGLALPWVHLRRSAGFEGKRPVWV